MKDIGMTLTVRTWIDGKGRLVVSESGWGLANSTIVSTVDLDNLTESKYAILIENGWMPPLQSPLGNTTEKSKRNPATSAVTTRIFNLDKGVPIRIAEYKEEILQKELKKRGWRLLDEYVKQSSPIFIGVDLAKQCRNCINAESKFVDYSSDSEALICPEGIVFCTKKGIKVPAEWDGCEDGFEAIEVSTAPDRHWMPEGHIIPIHNHSLVLPQYPEVQPKEAKEDTDQDQICADLAEQNRKLDSENKALEEGIAKLVERNQELESRIRDLVSFATKQEKEKERLKEETESLYEARRDLLEEVALLKRENAAIDQENDERLLELDNLQADYASLKVALRRYAKLDGEYRLLADDEQTRSDDEVYNHLDDKWERISSIWAMCRIQYHEGRVDDRAGTHIFAGKKAIIRRKIKIA